MKIRHENPFIDYDKKDADKIPTDEKEVPLDYEYNQDQDDRLELNPREDFDEDDHTGNSMGWGYQRSYREPLRNPDSEREGKEELGKLGPDDRNFENRENPFFRRKW